MPSSNERLFYARKDGAIVDNNSPPRTGSGVPPLHRAVTIQCNYRTCLEQRNGQCTAKVIQVIDGRCSSITRGKDAMRSDVPPMERRHGSLQNKQR